MKTLYKLVLTLIIYLNIALSQFYGYQSVGFGYHKNPLYNYQKIGDQIKQTYTEISYKYSFSESQLNINYISGLMLFNKLESRNYYEHKIFSTYQIRYPKIENSLTSNPSTSSEEYNNSDSSTSNDEEENEEPINNKIDKANTESNELIDENFSETTDDSTDSYLDIGLIGSARHDKKVYKEFDNFGVDALTSYRFMITEKYYLRIYNTVTFRNYYNIKELSNLTEKLTIQLTKALNNIFNYGFKISAGYKYYTLTVYDTSKYEPVRTFVEKKPGTGKPGAKLRIYSDKQILIKPQDNGTWQIIPEIFATTNFGNNSIEISFLYYYNPKMSVRYLAQYANTSILSEDIYNDNFSYEGFRTKLRLKFLLPSNVQALLDVDFQKKQFGGPALNLIGEKIANKRKDIRSSIELYASRYFNIFDDLGLDIYLSGAILRNQSNDHYNDFSLYSIAGGIGIGF